MNRVTYKEVGIKKKQIFNNVDTYQVCKNAVYCMFIFKSTTEKHLEISTTFVWNIRATLVPT